MSNWDRRNAERVKLLVEIVSLEREAPDFDSIGLPLAAILPAVRWKLDNLARRSGSKREADRRKLLETLERLRRE